MHPGSQQDRRLSPALTSGYFQPDEWSLAQRLRQLLQLARHLRFVDTQGHDVGHWGQGLAQDLSLLLAELSALPLDAWEARAARFVWMTPAQGLAECLGLARRLDQWCVCLDNEQPAAEQPLRQVLRTPLWRALSEVLGPQLQSLLGQAGPQPAWHAVWGLRAAEPAPSSGEAAPVLARRLRLFWLALCRLLRHLQALAQEQLEASLATGLHDPGVGLLLAWSQLLQRSREPLNAFNDRLTRYYHEERLGFRTAPAQADRVHLVLERDPRELRPVMLPQGWRVVAHEGRESCSYAAEHPLSLSPLSVTRLLNLRLEQDPLISPESEFGYATRALARSLAVPSPEAAADPRAPALPLLGGGAGSEDACQGLALASPLLFLCEGLRDIALELQLGTPAGLAAVPPGPGQGLALSQLFRQLAGQEAAEGVAGTRPPDPAVFAPEQIEALLRSCPELQDTPWMGYLLLRCLSTSEPAALAQRLGRLFAIWLCGAVPDLSLSALTRLRVHVQQVLGERAAVDVDDPLYFLFGQATMERSLVFDRVFRGAWQVRLSTPGGWLVLDEVFASRASCKGREAEGGRLAIRLRLTPDQAPIVATDAAVHGPDWPALPVLQLRLQNRSRLFAGSLLQHLRLEAVHLQVRVSGLSALQIHNQLGRLDPGKPFAPFGPLPDSASYLVFGHAELAAKPLGRLQLNLRWNGLPAGGLARHYAGYPDGPWQESDFRCGLSLLSDGRWQEANLPPLPLFPPRGRNAVSLAVSGAELLRLHHPEPPRVAPGGGAVESEFSLASRQGFFRLRLSSPAAAFGHGLYPRLMTETLTRNSRLKRPQPLPQPPYTPVLEAMTVDYEASQRVGLRPDATSGQQGELLAIMPFGLQPLRSLPQSCPVHVLQRWPGSGQLYIGLDGPVAEGSLSLLFALRSEAAQEALGRPTPELQWQAWCGDCWRRLEPHRVLMDSTEGLLRSGLVVLDLPAGMSRGCQALPGQGFWLCLSGHGELALLAGLIGVWANGLRACRLGAGTGRPLPAGAVRAAQAATPGLAAVRQPWPSFDLRPAESPMDRTVRAAERLRHRMRALTPWDIEHLVLQAFPEVFKVKCIPVSEAPADQMVRVVVVPALPVGHEPDGTEAPRLDAATLQRIAGYLAERMPPGPPLLVRNASYERIQVRCGLRLVRGEPAGERLRELNQRLRDYLSPWRPGGVTTQFDWQLRAEDVASFLRAQPGVDSVGQVSLLQVVRSDQAVYRLSDTARGSQVVRPAAPWSLALPTRGHLLELSAHPPTQAAASGLGRLTIGSSFIVGRDAA